MKSEIRRTGMLLTGFQLYSERETNTDRCKILPEFPEAQSYLQRRKPALLNSDQLSLSPVCDGQLQGFQRDSSSLYGPLRWGSGHLSRCCQQGWPPWEEARAAGWAFASQPRWTHSTWAESSSFPDRQAIVPRAQCTWPTEQLELQKVPFFSWCVFQHRHHKDKPVVSSFLRHPKRLCKQTICPKGPTCQSMISLLWERVGRKSFSPLKMPSPSPWSV